MCQKQQRVEAVFLIHGTNSNDSSDTGSRWWQRESDFYCDLTKRLGPDFDIQPKGHVFHWSGQNSEDQRREAARDLAKRLTQFEEEGRAYHLIGHSHGGSVVWQALIMMAESRTSVKQLRSWTTVGTPFLHYRKRTLSHWYALPILAGAATALFLLPYVQSYLGMFSAAYLDPESEKIALSIFPLLWVMPLLVLILATLRFGTSLYTSLEISKERRAARNAYQTLWERYLGIWCDADEAIGGLASTLALNAPIVPRMRRKPSSFPANLLTALTFPIRAFYNRVLAKASDDFIWERVTRRLQGSDRSKYELVSVSRGPIETVYAWPQLPDKINDRLVEHGE